MSVTPAAEETLSLDRYASEAKGLVSGAQTLADERKHVEVEPIHLLARALDRGQGVAEVFRRAGADPAEAMSLAESALGRLPKNQSGVAYLSPALLDLLARAERERVRDREEKVRPEHLLNALSQELRGAAGEVLSALRLGPGAFRPYATLLAARTAAGAGPSEGKYTRDLVALVESGKLDPVIGRAAEVRRVLQVLERRHKRHPLLAGEPGVGKSSVVLALAARIADGEVPGNLAGARLVELDAAALSSGLRSRAELEQRILGILAALRKERPGSEIIVVADNLETLDLKAGAAGSGGAGDLVRALLGKDDVRVLATTTPEGLKKIEERDAALLRRFTVVPIERPSVETATEILRGIASRYEAHHDVAIGEEAITAAVRLAARYAPDRALPDSAIDLLDETAAKKRVAAHGVPKELDEALRRLDSLRHQRTALDQDEDRASIRALERLDLEIRAIEPTVIALRERLSAERKDAETRAPTRPIVTENDVATTIAEWTGIPVARMLEEEADKLLRLEERLSARVVGQDEAVRAIARAVRRGRVGLRDVRRPIGSFLFLGPSGVGKTELAKALAELLFDDEQAMTRLDMSEFMERHMVARLLGAPPGYVDSEQGGFLTEAVRRRPYSVILFDEVEKAHADVFNLLLQILDDGRLTDARGRLTDFSNTVLIMTSNIGSPRILEADPITFADEQERGRLRDALLLDMRKFFRPEFINRIDDTAVFQPLAKDHLRRIVDIQLRQLERMLSDRELKLHMTEGAKSYLVDLAYDPAFGARPLKRTLQKLVQDPLAEEILADRYRNGDSITVDVKDGALDFSRAGSEANPPSVTSA